MSVKNTIAKLTGGNSTATNQTSAQPGDNLKVKKQRKSVLVIVQNLPVAIDRRVRQECGALIDAGYTVSVICPKGEADEPDARYLDGIGVYSYPPPPEAKGVKGYVFEFAYCWLQTARLSLRVRRERGFKAIHACNPPDTYWALAALYKPFGTKFVFDEHDLNPEVYEARFGKTGGLHKALLFLQRMSYKTANKVIATNDSYAGIARERGGFAPQDVVVVRSSPDPEKMKRALEPDLSLKKQPNLVAYVGIMGPQDGVDVLVEAADHVVKTRGRDDIGFVLMGFGDCLKDLQADVTRRGLDSHVTFTGRVGPEEMKQWMSVCTIGATPDPVSRFNDLSTMNKTFEYMAHELPVVAFDLTENKNSSGEAALIVDEGAANLGDGIIALIDDPAKRAEMAKLGRERIEGSLSWQHQARALVGLYDGLIG